MSATATTTATPFSFPSEAESSRWAANRNEHRGEGSSRVFTQEHERGRDPPGGPLSHRISTSRINSDRHNAWSTGERDREEKRWETAASDHGRPPPPTDLVRRIDTSKDTSFKEKKMYESDIHKDEIIVIRSLPSNILLKAGLIVNSLKKAGVHGVRHIQFWQPKTLLPLSDDKVIFITFRDAENAHQAREYFRQDPSRPNWAKSTTVHRFRVEIDLEHYVIPSWGSHAQLLMMQHKERHGGVYERERSMSPGRAIYTDDYWGRERSRSPPPSSAKVAQPPSGGQREYAYWDPHRTPPPNRDVGPITPRRPSAHSASSSTPRRPSHDSSSVAPSLTAASTSSSVSRPRLPDPHLSPSDPSPVQPSRVIPSPASPPIVLRSSKRPSAADFMDAARPISVEDSDVHDQTASPTYRPPPHPSLQVRPHSPRPPYLPSPQNADTPGLNCLSLTLTEDVTGSSCLPRRSSQSSSPVNHQSLASRLSYPVDDANDKDRPRPPQLEDGNARDEKHVPPQESEVEPKHQHGAAEIDWWRELMMEQKVRMEEAEERAVVEKGKVRDDMERAMQTVREETRREVRLAQEEAERARLELEDVMARLADSEARRRELEETLRDVLSTGVASGDGSIGVPPVPPSRGHKRSAPSYEEDELEDDASPRKRPRTRRNRRRRHEDEPSSSLSSSAWLHMDPQPPASSFTSATAAPSSAPAASAPSSMMYASPEPFGVGMADGGMDLSTAASLRAMMLPSLLKAFDQIDGIVRRGVSGSIVVD